VTDAVALQDAEPLAAEWIRVRGLVQGVGFRPTVWRLARQRGLCGSVANDGQGVSIHVCGSATVISDFVESLVAQAPPLARIEHVERQRTASLPPEAEFRIVPSRATPVHTGIVPDAATCRDCQQEIADPGARRHRYPFTNCTHCGPRLSIIEAIPYDRGGTTMRAFQLCPACDAEYRGPADRRFHAQPIACPACGPQAWLEPTDDGGMAGHDALEATSALLLRGCVVAIKGLGGFQLACDATDEQAVARLRQGKRRERKPFALMARDLGVVRRYCAVTPQEEALLQAPAAPVVILPAAHTDRVAPGVAPGIVTLGVMLPNTPLHHLVLRGMDRPIVLTSGNVSDEPQCIANAEAMRRLGGIADHFLVHDRDIAWRIDDSVVCVMADAPRLLRRARGHAPAPCRSLQGSPTRPRCSPWAGR
jgi:hydrogenase maturation protein HypF